MRSPRQAGLLLAALLSSAALTGAPPASGATVTVRGRVLDDAGRPARGAAVELAPLRTHYDASLAAWRGEQDPEPSARAGTDEHGVYSLVAPEPGFWKVVVRARSFVPVELTLAPLLEDVHLSDLLLVRDAGLEVTVLALAAAAGATPASPPERTAVAPPHSPDVAWVQLLSGERRSGSGPYAGGWRAARGIARGSVAERVRLPRGAGDAVKIRAVVRRGATAAGSVAPQIVAIGDASAAGSAARVELKPVAARSLVRVTEDGGTPIASALIFAGDLGLPLGMTDAEGRAEIAAAASDPLELTVLTADGRGQTFTVRSAERRDGVAVLAMRRAARLAGSVVDDADLSPLPAAWVWADPPRSGSGLGGRSELLDVMLGELSAVTRAADRGRFVLPVVAGTQVRAAAPGYAGASVLDRPFPFGGPPEAAIPTEPTVVRLRRSRWVGGTVVDAGGSPVAGVLVVPYAGPAQARNRQRSITDAQGRFRIAGWGADKIVALATGYAPTVQTVDLGVALFRDDLRLVLRRGRVARGRVLDLDQRPVAGARVRLVETREGGHDAFPSFFPFRTTPPLLTATVADGGFEIAGVASGFYDLTVDAAGHAVTAVPGVEIPAGDGDPDGDADAGVVDLGILLVGPGVVIEGLVTDREEVPLPGVTIRAQRKGAFERIAAASGPEPWSAWLASEPRRPDPVSTDAAGRFTLRDLNPSEKIDLVAALEGYASLTAPGVAGPTEQPIVLVLERAATVRGQVVDQDDHPVPRVRLIASGPASSPRSAAASDSEGRFELGPLDPGSWQIEAKAPGYETGENVTVELPGGGVQEGVRIVLREQEHGELEGRVVDEDGTPFPGATVSCGAAGQARSGSGGEFRFERVPLGRQQVRAGAPGGLSAVETVEVRKGVNTVELELDRGVEVSGRVVDGGGGAVAGATVMLRASPASRAAMQAHGAYWGTHKSATTDTAGAFVLAGVREGVYDLTAEVTGRSRGRLPGELRVADAPVAGLELVLEPGGVIRGALQGLDFDQLSQVTLGARGENGVAQGRVIGGEYEIANLDAGSWRVTGEVPTHGLRAEGRVTLEAGAEARLDLDFGAGLTLSGGVTRRGEPAAGKLVFLRGLDVAVQRATRVDFEGRYLLRGLEEGVYEVSVSAVPSSGPTRVSWMRRLELREDTELAIELGGGKVAGVVVDASSGDPIPGATVRLRASVSTGDFADARRTGAAGEFLYEDVLEGGWSVHAVAEGYANREVQFELREGAEVEGVVLELEPSSGLVLRVTGAFGFPGSIVVVIVDRGGRPISTWMSLSPGVNQGVFEVANVGEGAWGVLVGSPGLATVRIDVRVPGPPVDVSLPLPARLEVEIPELLGTSAVAELEVFDALGRPFLALSPASYGMTWRMESGRTFVEALPPGQWTLRARSHAGAVWSGVAATAPGGLTQVRLQ